MRESAPAKKHIVGGYVNVISEFRTSNDRYAIPDIADPEFFDDQFNELE